MFSKSEILNPKSKILCVVGPTSSGKSELAVRLAKKFNGEIISCDSRQIYRGMDLGTGKVEGKWVQFSPPIIGGVPRAAGGGGKHFVYKKIPHHLIDFINPKRRYSAALFQHDAKKVIADILARGKLPILCGGTAQWIDSVVYNQQIPDVKPNFKLRANLEKKSVDDLYLQLKKLDSVRAKNIDKFNKRRLIRALEIVITTGKPVPPFGGTLSEARSAESKGLYDALWLGINPPQAELFAKIKKRLKQRLDSGMIKEVSRLHRGSLPFSKGEARRGLSWKKLESFGLEYKFVSLYLQKKISYDEMSAQLFTAIKQYSKRQMTWWKRNNNIRWITKPEDAQKLTKNFLNSP